MNYSEFLSAELKNFISDLRAEVVAAELLERGLKADDINFYFKGIKRRPFSQDIADIKLAQRDEKKEK